MPYSTLEIVLIINHPAEVILLDKPFSRIEPIIKDRIINIIENKKEEKCFIIADHDYRGTIKNLFHKLSNSIFLQKNCQIVLFSLLGIYFIFLSGFFHYSIF